MNSTETRKDLAVLMTVHNRREKTLRCLEILYAQPLPAGWRMTVYLTDDGCTDGTGEAVASHFPKVRIIPADGDLFWCRGMRRAWEAALQEGPADLYLWLNDDTFLHDDVLLRGGDALLHHPDSIVVGPVQSGVKGIFSYGGRSLKGHILPEGKERRLDTFDGNFVLVPESVRRRIGILDARFSHAMGDTEYGLRARRAGVPIWQMAEFVGICELHERPSGWCDPQVPLMERFRVLYSPLGLPPNEYFYLEKTYFDLSKAVLHWITIHLRTLVPFLWRQ